ncbi:hypothetical protein DFH06DRAFT_758569 [Mycena polygramma]|nr:hypothetical protein DFH06DRAFT_758569 [Mycena polygramma]
MHAGREADRARVSKIQIQIVELEQTLSQLRIEQSQAQERLDSYRYPVLTLPTELVSEIFLHVLPRYPNFPELTGLSSPTPLTQICRRWRDIALGTPELWSAISSLNNNLDGRELRIFEFWLNRSRHCPLSITLATDVAWACDELVEAVIPHRARWQHLKFEVESKHLRIFDGPMPLLRHLELITEDDGTEGDPIVVHGVPLLRTVVLNDVAAVRIVLPWTQLTSLTLIRVFPSEFVAVLVQTRNLVHCELRVFHDSFSHAVSHRDTRIQLPCLESLTLVHCGIHPVTTDRLPTFVVPALRSLKIPETFLSPDPIGSLTAFISTSDCRLEELHLTGERLPPGRSYREAFPSLREVSFSNEISDDPIELDFADS